MQGTDCWSRGTRCEQPTREKKAGQAPSGGMSEQCSNDGRAHRARDRRHVGHTRFKRTSKGMREAIATEQTAKGRVKCGTKSKRKKTIEPTKLRSDGWEERTFRCQNQPKDEGKAETEIADRGRDRGETRTKRERFKARSEPSIDLKRPWYTGRCKGCQWPEG